LPEDRSSWNRDVKSSPEADKQDSQVSDKSTHFERERERSERIGHRRRELLATKHNGDWRNFDSRFLTVVVQRENKKYI
jgi:hypothetical protein